MLTAFGVGNRHIGGQRIGVLYRYRGLAGRPGEIRVRQNPTKPPPFYRTHHVVVDGRDGDVLGSVVSVDRDRAGQGLVIRSGNCCAADIVITVRCRGRSGCERR